MAVTKRFNFDAPSELEFSQVNSGFARVKLSVMTHEQVANGTHFNKEVINQNLSTINYIPIVAEYKEEANDFGTHGGQVIIDDDGFRFVETTKPYGVVINDSAKWENIKLKNGETVEYLTVEAFLWIERYPELNCLYEGKANNQSMEVSVKEAHFNEDTWVYEIDKFQFSALCLLGKEILPAFDEAKAMTDYSKQDFKADYSEMMSALNIYLQNNGMEVFSNLENEIKDEVIETEEFENKDETLETETVDNFEEESKSEEIDDENKEFDNESDDEKAEEEFTEEEVEIVADESVDYEKLYNDLKTEYDALVETNKDLSEFKQTKVKEEKEEMFSAFSNKLTSDEMQPVRDMIDSLDKEVIETQLFALVGKKADEDKLNFEKKGKTKIGLFDNDDSNMSDGLKAVISRKKK
jgi:hypothetical protein